MSSMALLSVIIHELAFRLICFKLILTSFHLALFPQVSFSVISFLCRCFFVFSTWRFFVLSPGIIWYLYIYHKNKCNNHCLCL